MSSSTAAFLYDLAYLRRRAELAMQGQTRFPPAAPPQDSQALLHELQTHQVELEMQNEDLRLAQRELHASQAGLEEERYRYETLFDLAPEAYLVTDLRGRIQEANAAACRLLGQKSQRLVGAVLPLFFSEPHTRLVLDLISAMREGRASGPKQVEATIQQGGRTVECEISVNEVRKVNGQLLGLRWLMHDIAGRKRTQALRESERYLAEANRQKTDILESISDSFYALDRELRFIYLNKAAEKLWGVERPRLLGRKFEEFFPGTIDLSLSTLRQVLEEQTPQHYETYSEAVRRWGSVSVYPAQEGVSVYFRDITERKQAEEALRESQARMAADLAALTRMHELSKRMFEQASLEGFLQGVIEAAAAIASAEFGTLQLLEGEALRIVAHHGHQAPFLEFFAAAETRASVCREAARRGERVVVADVEASPVFAGTDSLAVLRAAGVRAAQSTPLLSRGGQLLGVLTTQWRQPHAPDEQDLWRIDLLARQAADVIEHARSEQALRESESRAKVAEALEGERKRLYAVLETLPAMVCLLTPDYHLAFANRSFRERFGECRGRLCYEACFGEDAPCSFCQTYNVLKTGRPHHWEVKGPDGSTIDVHDFPFTDVDGSPMILEMDVDITEFRNTQAALKEANQTLEERRAKLHELVGELEHFSYTITHDLKSPLRAMSGFAELARLANAEGETRKANEFLAKIATSAERMYHLIADALNYSRLGRQELPLTDVDTGALLRGMLDSYPELQREKEQIRVEGRLPVVLANEAGLTQCFSNLLGNAVKFVRPGEKPEIRVWASETLANDHPSGWARIWVEDKGIGISREMMPRLFDMFSRGSKNYEGTGIGLALVRKVVQRMGGRAGAESEEGHGSRFWIELRCGETRSAPGTAEPARREPEAGTVLYVEDEENDAMFMQRAFAAKGLKSALQIVTDGRAAIDYLSGAGEYADRKEHPLPSVVLLDVNLPQVPGFEVLKWIRNNPDFARTPVLMFSSSSREDDQVKARELGANEFVAKPSSGMLFGGVVEKLRKKWLVRKASQAAS